MFGYIAGYTDSDETNFCPYCGAEIGSRYCDGTAECADCKRRFGVIEADFGVMEEEDE